ncbi:MAG: hypothetical protein E6J13_17125 [Chloroflexi bacterium]|nr:MAG: hypothetical protein E6J13_17125 [Chloroflexota bacterium]
MGLALVFALAALGVVAAAGFAAVSFLASRDPVIIRDDVQEHTARLVQTEDRIVQNEMSSVIYIKRPLWFRRLVLKSVLAVINLSAKYLSNQGTLAGIPSIHFARWVVVDEGRRLVFFSNFDGSWENYLGDFIDKAHTGLTAVWSNCVGFPRTVFKAYSRQSQVPTQVWYSAYRWLTVSNINDNTRLRLGLYGDMDAAAAQDWLRIAAPRQRLALKRRKEPSPSTAVEVDDVQGLVVRSYRGLDEAVYVPAVFESENISAARAWVADLAAIVTRAAPTTEAVAEDGRAVNVAFTYAGLKALGLEKKGIVGFSREFREGIAEEHRQRLLGDAGPADPIQWKWGGPKNPPIHAMLFLFAAGPKRLAELRAAERARAVRHGVTLGEPLETITLPDGKEHFGFHDGIAQPLIAGLKSSTDAASKRFSGTRTRTASSLCRQRCRTKSTAGGFSRKCRKSGPRRLRRRPAIWDGTARTSYSASCGRT